MAFVNELPLPPKVRRMMKQLLDAGATDCLLVGGVVRDFLRGALQNVPGGDIDYDIEVYGLSYEEIVATLKPKISHLVGKSFGTIKIGTRIDIAIPRRESKKGVGHKGFDVVPDPTMTFAEAASRRDFTVNAMGMRLDGTILDPWGGRADLEHRILRATSSRFADDPLRVLRGMQFAARFDMEMEPSTAAMCQHLFAEFETLSRERVWEEWKKWALRGCVPSCGLKVLRQTGWVNAFPELAALIDVPQNPKWHPEGDVWEHTLLACDAAAELADAEEIVGDDRLALIFAALCHDFGKPMTTVRNEKGNWSSPRHSEHSASLVPQFFARFAPPARLEEHVVPLVREHMAHMVITSEQHPSDAMVRRLAARLTPSSIKLWSVVCRADAMGCLARGTRTTSWESVAAKLAVREKQPKPLLMGRDLIARGFAPGPEMGEQLRRAYDAQLDGRFDSLEGALQWLEADTQQRGNM